MLGHAHGPVLLNYSYFTFSPRRVRALVRSAGFSFALKETVFRRKTGQVCLEQENLISMLKFLENGFINRCVTQENFDQNSQHVELSSKALPVSRFRLSTIKPPIFEDMVEYRNGSGKVERYLAFRY